MTILWLLMGGCTPEAALPPATPPDAVPDLDPPSTNKTVDCAGAGDYATIQAAINAAADGDTVDVKPCTYTETIDFNGKTVTLRATSGTSDTILDGGGSGPVVTAISGEGRGTAVIGFTITGGSASDGAAVYVDLSRLRLEDVEVTGNRGDTIVHDYTGSLEMQRVTVSGNTISASGSAVYHLRGGLDVAHLTVDCDGGANAVSTAHGTVLADWSNIACSGGTAWWNEHSTGRVQRTRFDGAVLLENEEDVADPSDVTIIENSILLDGAWVEECTAEFRNSVIVGSLELHSVDVVTIEGNIFTGSTCAIDSDSATVGFDPEYNLFDTGTEGCLTWSGSDGNIAGNPKFTDAAGGDYTLASSSPAIDAGMPGDEHDDVDGSRNDIGAYGGRKTLAGGW